ncbi:uncharacterized protein LOC120336638 [Styela clava]
MEEADRALALALQEEYDKEYANPGDEYDQYDTQMINNNVLQSKKFHDGKEKPKSIVDPSWELLDPSPDVRVMFQEFNAMYFWSKLSMVEVRWSPRMTLCAGLCCYEGRGGLCSIRLSKPLLQLRPRKDLVETLLHEMIHALLFVTDNNKDHDGHGPEFCKHMYRINKETGTNITIYHNFHDEVDQLRQHWWRCQGSCRTKPPYFGFVKRSMNRAPSPRDTWWPRHQMTCGGTYIKVKEPENFGKKKEKKEKPKEKGVMEITSFLSQQTKKGKELRDSVEQTNPVVQSRSNDTGESSKTGNRLGGQIYQKDNSGRGIPAHSRLLSKFDNKDNNNTKLNSNINLLESPTTDKKQPSLEDRWGNLLSGKRKNIVNNRVVPKKKAKDEITIPELLERMKRKGKKSVNAGAPAFVCTPALTSYSKRAIYFHDSQEERENSQSDKENINVKIHPVKRANTIGIEDDKKNILFAKKESTDVGNNDILKTSHKNKNKVHLPSFDSDSDEECSLTDVLNRSKRQDGLTSALLRSKIAIISDDDDDDLPEIEFSFSQVSGSNDDSHGDVAETSTLKNNAVTRIKSGSLSKRLPSLSESDDSETMVGNMLKKPANKKLKIDDNPCGTENINPNLVFSSEPVIDTAPCPICCNEVPISTINSHIDECLSLKAIRDSAFD